MRSGNAILIVILALCVGLVLADDAAGQNKTYIWVRASEAGQYPGYRTVIGGRLDKGGVELPVCRGLVNGFLVPGKLYGASCLIPWNGKELNIMQNVDVFMTNRSWSWRQVFGLSKAQIQQGAVATGTGQRSTGHEYVCRWRFPNGVHNGKYALGNGICYVAYGGKEHAKSDGFEIMFP